ncbi:histidine phosphatase family protein [Kribbella sp. NPDC050241]|uniref:histidine phosphatase family protein n=1 Tax=Kribbella sp. NPDC050241 TaxID=3364115 RepID=UPI0037B3C5C6
MSRTELVLLRHGESLWNAEDRYQGQQGTGLSALGHQQAKLAAEYLRSDVFDQIVASDLQRVTETLQPYLDSLPLADTVGTVDAVDAAGGRGAGCSEWGGRSVVRVDRRWREIDVGSWGGRTFADVYADEPTVVEAFRRGEDVARGGGETFAQLRERVWDAIREIAGSGARRVLVVTHGGPIRVATASTLRLPPGGEVLLDPPVNCSLTTIQVDDLLAVTTLTAYNVPTSGIASTEEQPA